MGIIQRQKRNKNYKNLLTFIMDFDYNMIVRKKFSKDKLII